MMKNISENKIGKLQKCVGNIRGGVVDDFSPALQRQNSYQSVVAINGLCVDEIKGLLHV